MEITLKNVKHAVFMSQETDCFEASVYIDGKRAGKVSNDGHGGCNFYYPNSLFQALNDHCQSIPPDMTGGRVTPDEVIGNLFEAWFNKREYSRLCKGRTLFRIPGREYKTNQWNVEPTPFSENVRAAFVTRYGAGVEFLNDMIGGAR